MYVPFLKFKKNEILSLKFLERNLLDNVTPFFDVPRIKDMDESDFIKRIAMAKGDLTRHWSKNKKIFLDTFDIDQDLRPDGLCPYSYAVQNLDQAIIPVVGLDRDDEHFTFVNSYISEMEIKEVAIRFLPDDFECYELIEDEIDEFLGKLIAECDFIDIVLDCRILVENKENKTAEEASDFANKFCENYDVRNVILTSSSIPASISNILPTNSETYFPRNEKQVWEEFNRNFDQNLANSVYGDYGVISPEYSDIDLPPQVLATIASPKAIYTLDNQYYAARGSRFRTHADGYGQYFNLARHITSKSFFRGASFSTGDEYIHQKSQNIPKPGSPQTWIKNTLNAHIAYIASNVT